MLRDYLFKEIKFLEKLADYINNEENIAQRPLKEKKEEIVIKLITGKSNDIKKERDKEKGENKEDIENKEKIKIKKKILKKKIEKRMKLVMKRIIKKIKLLKKKMII